MQIASNLSKIRNELPADIKLVVVSKTQTNKSILEAYQFGERVFGENRIQELVSKQESLPKDIEWHMIGHLQTNKVKYIAPFVSLIHAVDSFKLLKEINKQAKKNNRIIKCLLQFHIASEESKHGFTSLGEMNSLLSSQVFKGLSNVQIIGVMGMATNTNDEKQIRSEFKALKAHFEELKQSYFSEQKTFKELSMGMSGDYQIALKENSTIVRIGSNVFS